MITSEQEKQYIKKGGVQCPVCGNYDIQGNSIYIDSGSASQKVLCPNCDTEWTDVYTLTSIEQN